MVLQYAFRSQGPIEAEEIKNFVTRMKTWLKQRPNRGLAVGMRIYGISNYTGPRVNNDVSFNYDQIRILIESGFMEPSIKDPYSHLSADHTYLLTELGYQTIMMAGL